MSGKVKKKSIHSYSLHTKNFITFMDRTPDFTGKNFENECPMQ